MRAVVSTVVTLKPSKNLSSLCHLSMALGHVVDKRRYLFNYASKPAHPYLQRHVTSTQVQMSRNEPSPQTPMDYQRPR